MSTFEIHSVTRKPRSLFSSLLCFFVLLGTSGHCQTISVKQQETFKTQILAQADSMGTALQKHDFKTFVGFVYPGLVKMAGGRESMLQELLKGASEMDIRSVKCQQPATILVADNQELQSALLQISEIKTPAGIQTFSSILIAISTDRGQHWSFLDTHNADIATVRRAFPNVSEALVLRSANR